MSIKDEFKKMKQTTTDPTQVFTEAWRPWEDDSNVQDAEMVSADDIDPIIPPKIITTPKPTAAEVISLFGELKDPVAEEVVLIRLLKAYKKYRPNAFHNILTTKLMENIMMPQAQITPPEPQAVPSEEAPKSFRERLEELKNEIEAKKADNNPGEPVDPEKEKAYDDITSAFDLIAHHLDDINEGAEDQVMTEGPLV